MIALYNTEKKELMAVFRSTAMASIFLYGNGTTGRDRLRARMYDKVRIENTRFPFVVAARPANSKHMKLLADKDGIIFEGYPEYRTMIVGGNRYTNFENAKTYQDIL